jgi:hypothetical protein
MKRLTRLSIAIAIALLFAVVSVGVWASPGGRSGTVPTPVDAFGTCGSGAAKSFGTGTVNVTGSSCTVRVTRGGPFNQPPTGWNYLLSDVLEVKLVSGAVSQVEVCVPFNPDWKNKVAGESINFFYWNTAKNAWIAIPTVIKNNETPPVVCGTSTSVGFYALFGK